MQDVRVLIFQEKGLIWGYKKEEKEGTLLLFRGCPNSVVKHNIENNITLKKKKIKKNTRHICKSLIIPLFEFEFFEYNGAFLYRPTLDLLGLWLLIWLIN